MHRAILAPRPLKFIKIPQNCQQMSQYCYLNGQNSCSSDDKELKIGTNEGESVLIIKRQSKYTLEYQNAPSWPKKQKNLHQN